MGEKISQKNLNKFYEEQELIVSPYYKKNDISTILTGSDIHYQPNVDKQIFRMFVAHAREVRPTFIVMPGDIFETINFIDIPSEKEFFETFIKDLAEVAPVIMIPGNHEIGNFDTDKYTSRDYSANTKALSYLESLNKIKNVYFLNNEQTLINGVMFLGFNPRLATYLKNADPTTDDMFVEDYIKSGLRMAEADYNILLTHSSLPLNQERVFNSVEDFKSLTDLVVSGHWHDGYLPKKLDKFLGKTNVGLFFTPLVAPVPGIVCRGVHDFGRGYMFISQGYRKWTADIGIFNAFEKITANDVERLIITNPEIVVPELPKGLAK